MDIEIDKLIAQYEGLIREGQLASLKIRKMSTNNDIGTTAFCTYTNSRYSIIIEQIKLMEHFIKDLKRLKALGETK